MAWPAQVELARDNLCIEQSFVWLANGPTKPFTSCEGCVWGL